MPTTLPPSIIPRDTIVSRDEVGRVAPPNDATDAARWRHVAALMREIDEAKRGGPGVKRAENFHGMDDDDLLDLALKALRDFPVLVQRRHDYRLITDRLRRHRWTWTNDPTEAIDDAARKLVQRVQLLDVFEAVNAVAGPNVWLKRMREAIAQMDHNDGDSMLDLLGKALDARGTVDDMFGVWDTTGPDEGGETGDTGDVDG